MPSPSAGEVGRGLHTHRVYPVSRKVGKPLAIQEIWDLKLGITFSELRQ